MRRVAAVTVGIAVVAGIVGMHALMAADVEGGPRHEAVALSAATASAAQEIEGAVVSASSPVGHGSEHVTHGLAGGGHAAAQACLALLVGILLWVVSRASRIGLALRLPGGDDLAALAVSMARRRRPAPRPDLHALSILRC